ncbi:hypothetical protein BH23GEM10_BH23GEM10_08510 [soil metagenome]
MRHTGDSTASSMSSTEAQNNFGEVLSRALREGRVFITRYSRPEVVVLSLDAYEALVAAEPIDLDLLEHEFNELIARMQSSDHHRAVDALFDMTSEDLGQAAVEGATETN